MKNINKIIKYNFYGQTYNLALQIANYYINNEICINILYYDEDLESWEDFDTLTINLNLLKEEENEIFINSDISKDLIKKLEKLKIITLKNDIIHYNMGTYEKAFFNYDIAKKYIINEVNND